MKNTLLAFAALAAVVIGLKADDKKPAADANVVGAALSKTTLHRIDGKKFKEAELTKSPEYFILYYSASW